MAKKVAKKAPAKKESAVKKVASKVKELVKKVTAPAKPSKATKAEKVPAKKVSAKAAPVKAAPAKAAAKPVPLAKAKKAEKPVAAVVPAPAKVEAPKSKKEIASEKSKKEAAPQEKGDKTSTRKTVAELVESAKAPEKKERRIRLDKTGLSEDQIKWHEMKEKYRNEKPQNYSISGTFEAKKPIEHKTFGWGYVMSNEYDRLDVLFADGRRVLISNRKL